MDGMSKYRSRCEKIMVIVDFGVGALVRKQTCDKFDFVWIFGDVGLYWEIFFVS